MTDKPDDGGFAFPVPFIPPGSGMLPDGSNCAWTVQEAYHGMTYRQWLVGMAMQGILSRKGGGWGDLVAKEAIKEADALIAELKK